MKLLDRIEKRVEQLVEGLFTRTLKTAPHPIDIARALARTMDERAITSLSRTYVPNEFCVALHPDEFTVWSGIVRAICEELETYLAEHAADRQYLPSGSVRVTFMPDENLAPGTFRIDASMEDHQPLTPTLSRKGRGQDSGEGDEQTRVFRMPNAVLVGQDGTRYMLGQEPATLGRGEGCTIALNDPAVSREHARIEWAGDGHAVLDLDSKNGTLVNGAQVRRHVLQPGDRIHIGATTLDYQLEEP